MPLYGTRTQSILTLYDKTDVANQVKHLDIQLISRELAKADS